jgi:protein-S-isoprenylcysteine O-methyltransferase Ste14
MSARTSTLGKSLFFLVVAPGSVLVLVPWWMMPADWPLGIGVLSALGGPLVALGSLGLLRCVWDFASEGHGTPAPVDPPRDLVRRGLYRAFRNPMYVMVATVLVGEALALRAGELLAWAAVLWLAFHLFVVFYEEPTLRRKFGAPYEAYLASTPRWLPGRGTWRLWRDILPAAAGMLYTAGALVHVWRIASGLSLLDMPWQVDWTILLVGSVAGVGLVRFRHEIAYRGMWERVVHWLMVVHLLASVVLHSVLLATASHAPLGVFPLWYSGLAAGYFALFAARAWTMRTR